MFVGSVELLCCAVRGAIGAREVRARFRVVFCVSLLAALASLALTSVANAANAPFPGNGWVNPVTPASFEDWHFGSCDGFYLPNKAHLGADSQGTHAGQTAVAMGPGTVVKVVPPPWGPGGAIGVEHVASDGTHFVAVYGHINVGVSVGQGLSPGQAIGTLYDQGANSHLHIGVRPLAAGESAGSITLWGSENCSVMGRSCALPTARYIGSSEERRCGSRAVTTRADVRAS